MEVMIKRVEPLFSRKIKFLDLKIMQGEGYVDWAIRINETSQLADLDNIKSQDLMLMKYCQGLKQED